MAERIGITIDETRSRKCVLCRNICPLDAISIFDVEENDYT
jgi:formate hydrogenlyase subunit 6/NADH:ubiquinone oxidoreductase subunit I